MNPGDPANADLDQAETSIKLYLVSAKFYPLFSGAGLRFRNYNPGFRHRGIKMSVFTQAIRKEAISRSSLFDDTHLGPHPNLEDSLASPSFEIVDGLPISRTPGLNGWRSLPAYFTKALANGRQNENDIVHFLQLQSSAAPWVWRLRRLGIPTVLSCTMVGQLSQTPWHRILQRFQRRFVFNLVDSVVASTTVMERYLQNLGVSTPIVVIPNGVDLERFRPVKSESDKARVRHQLKLDPSTEIILAVGAVRPRKGTDTLVDAFALVSKKRPHARLILVGPKSSKPSGPPMDFYQRLMSTIENSDARGRVDFLGAKSNVEDYLRAADVLVFPSRREGMPNVMAEAMACGLPVITTQYIGLPDEFGVPGYQYELCDHSPDALASTINGLLENVQYRQHLGREARKWVEHTLDFNRTLDQYADLYRGLAWERQLTRPGFRSR